MKEYQVTVTYLVSVDAESESTAEQLALEFVKNGWEPNDIEIEEVPGEIIGNTIYVYFDEEFDNYEDILKHLVDSEEIKTFSDWINDTFHAATIYFNKFIDLEPMYKEYQEDTLEWLIQIGRVVKIIK